jgi:hypothetical protein
LIGSSLVRRDRDRRELEPIVTIFDRNPVHCIHCSIAQSSMVRIKQYHPWALVQLAIGHHLVDVGLGDALFLILSPPRDTLPFSVNHLFDYPVPLHENVGFGLEQFSALTGL